jgi:hypothetical protein
MPTLSKMQFSAFLFCNNEKKGLDMMEVVVIKKECYRFVDFKLICGFPFLSN